MEREGEEEEAIGPIAGKCLKQSSFLRPAQNSLEGEEELEEEEKTS